MVSILLHWDTSVRYYISNDKCIRADSDRPNQGYTLFIGIKSVNCDPW